MVLTLQYKKTGIGNRYTVNCIKIIIIQTTNQLIKFETC